MRCVLGFGVLGLLVVACSDDSNGDTPMLQTVAGRTINTRVFDCAGSAGSSPFEFTVRLGPGELALWLPFDFGIPYLVLSRDFDESDATYREGEVELRLREDSADLSVGDRSYRSCRLNPVRSAWEHAKLSGVAFRATGFGPSGYLEIRGAGALVFTADDNSVGIEARETVAATDEPSGTATYVADIQGQRLTVRISSSPCTLDDGTSMSGSEVIVTWDSRNYRGCGRALY